MQFNKTFAIKVSIKARYVSEQYSFPQNGSKINIVGEINLATCSQEQLVLQHGAYLRRQQNCHVIRNNEFHIPLK